MKKEKYTPKRSLKERFELTRNPDRIRSSDVIKGVFQDLSYYVSPDPSIIAAKGNVGGMECIILGQEKRKDKESEATGMMTAKGYKFAYEVMEIAESMGVPLVTLIDTYGGDPSMSSELAGQSFRISDCIRKLGEIKAPVITYVIGEGGSGGALGLNGWDKVAMFENSLYSVISPESCSRIIFNKALSDGTKLEDTVVDSLNVLQPGVEHLLEIGMVDDVLPEPPKGAHTNYDFSIGEIKKHLESTLNPWTEVNQNGKKILKKGIAKKLVKERREKVLGFGRFHGKFHTKWDEIKKRVTQRRKGLPDNVEKVDIEQSQMSSGFHRYF